MLKISTLLSLLLFLTVSLARAYEFEINDGAIKFYSWSLDKNEKKYLAFSDQDRDDYIAQQPSSATVTVDDFVSISPSLGTIAIAESIDISVYNTKSAVRRYLDRENDPSYIKEKIIEKLKQKYLCLEISKLGFDVSDSTKTLAQEINVYELMLQDSSR